MLLKNSPISQWRNYKHLYSLHASKCVSCKKIFYPKGYLCSCGSQKFELIKLSGKGKLLTFSYVVNPPEAFVSMVPYCIGIIELEEGVRMTAQITDVKLEDLSIGMKVQSVFRKFFASGQEGIINYGIKFIPVLK